MKHIFEFLEFLNESDLSNKEPWSKEYLLLS